MMMINRTAFNALTLAMLCLLRRQSRLHALHLRLLVTISVVALPTQSYAEQAQTLGQWEIPLYCA